jgi:hypothetical protein
MVDCWLAPCPAVQRGCDIPHIDPRSDASNIATRMNVARFRSMSRRRIAWLLWFGLLFPVAQAVAAMHGVSHIRQEPSRDAKADLAQQAHCDLCLIAAAIGGSAPATEPPVIVHATVADAQPMVAVSHAWLAPPEHVYRSRAPPFTPH